MWPEAVGARRAAAVASLLSVVVAAVGRVAVPPVGTQLPDAGSEQLEKVFIGRNNRDVKAALDPAPGDCPDDVVRLHAAGH